MLKFWKVILTLSLNFRQPQKGYDTNWTMIIYLKVPSKEESRIMVTEMIPEVEESDTFHSWVTEEDAERFFQ